MYLCGPGCRGNLHPKPSHPHRPLTSTNQPQKRKPFILKTLKRFLLWLYKKKFGEEEGAQMKQCIEETSSKGPSLLRMAGLDPRKLKADLKNKDAKIQIQVVKAPYLKLNAYSFSELGRLFFFEITTFFGQWERGKVASLFFFRFQHCFSML